MPAAARMLVCWRTSTIANVRAEGEAGVMGIAIDPLFSTNRFIFVCASRTFEGQWRNQVIRYHVTSNWKLQFNRYIIKSGMVASTIHNGCAVQVGPDQKLWVTMGDASHGDWAQDPDRRNGKVLRINRERNGAGRQPDLARPQQSNHRLLDRPSQPAGDHLPARYGPAVRGGARPRPRRRDQLDSRRPQLRVAVRHRQQPSRRARAAARTPGRPGLPRGPRWRPPAAPSSTTPAGAPGTGTCSSRRSRSPTFAA